MDRYSIDDMLYGWTKTEVLDRVDVSGCAFRAAEQLSPTVRIILELASQEPLEEVLNIEVTGLKNHLQSGRIGVLGHGYFCSFSWKAWKRAEEDRHRICMDLFDARKMYPASGKFFIDADGKSITAADVFLAIEAALRQTSSMQ